MPSTVVLYFSILLYQYFVIFFDHNNHPKCAVLFLRRFSCSNEYIVKRLRELSSDLATKYAQIGEKLEGLNNIGYKSQSVNDRVKTFS